jgi:hypothetical protein
VAALAQMRVEWAANGTKLQPVAFRKPGCSVGMAVCTADRYGPPNGAKRVQSGSFGEAQLLDLHAICHSGIGNERPERAKR